MKKLLKCIVLISPFVLTSCDVPFFRVVSSSYAKEFCSCYFVVQQTENYCKAYAKQIVPVSKYSIDSTNQTVLASGLGYETKVAYLGKKEGCKIQ